MTAPRYEIPFQRLPAGVEVAVRDLLALGYSHRAIVLELAGRGISVSNATVSRIRNAEVRPLTTEDRPPTRLEIEQARANQARALYQQEKARAAERSRQRAALADARRDFAALLERERERTKGGRPRKAAAFDVGHKPGKPQIVAQKPNAVDALWQSLPVYQGGA